MLPKSHLQEALSRAYIQAVAARCGLSYIPRGADYGLDFSIYEIIDRGNRYTEAGHQLDVQLKSTTAAMVEEAHVSYDLNVRAYDDLRVAEVSIPRILVVYVFPEEEADWLTWSEEQLVLRRGAYWLSLSEYPSVKNTRTLRVVIPRGNQFSVDGIRALMARLRQGERL